MFRLGIPGKDGVTLQSKLEQVEASTGKRPPALDHDPIPWPAESAFALWKDLNSGRGNNGWGASHLTWIDLQAWSQMRGLKPTFCELELIRTIDSAYLTITAEMQKGSEQ